MGFTEADIEKIISEKIYGLTLKKISSNEEELIASGVLSSITVAELAVELEKEFSITFSFIEVNKENFSTLHSLVRSVSKKLIPA